MERWVLGLAVVLLVLGTWWLSRRRPRLRMTDRGIHFRGGRSGWIRWEEIEGASPVRGGDAVVVRLRAGSRAASRLAERTLELDLAGSGLSPMELLRAVVVRGGQRRGPRRDAGPAGGTDSGQLSGISGT